MQTLRILAHGGPEDRPGPLLWPSRFLRGLAGPEQLRYQRAAMTARIPHPELTKNLILIGGRGCGKSSISKRLARRNRNFMLFSLDALIRYEAGGRSIPEIVEGEGWPGFRALELEVVEKLACFRNSALLDCGGGVVVELDEAGEEVFSQPKAAALREHGLVVYLYRESDYLFERISGDGNRPSLSEGRSFHEIMARRDPWYRSAAHWVLDCSSLGKTEIADRVLTWFYGEIGVDPGEALRYGRD